MRHGHDLIRRDRVRLVSPVRKQTFRRAAGLLGRAGFESGTGVPPVRHAQDARATTKVLTRSPLAANRIF